MDKIINIQMEGTPIIRSTPHVGFAAMGLMNNLEVSFKYVSTYHIIKQIRTEEKAIAKEAIKVSKNAEKIAKEQTKILALALLEKGVEIESIAKFLEITPIAVRKIINKKK